MAAEDYHDLDDSRIYDDCDPDDEMAERLERKATRGRPDYIGVGSRIHETIQRDMQQQLERDMNIGPEWVRVEAPERWRPMVGEAIDGVYAGRTDEVGQYGPYTQFLLRDRKDSRLYTVSGASAAALFANAALALGDRVLLVCANCGVTEHGNPIYTYQLYKRKT